MRSRWREFPSADLIYCRTELIGDDALVERLKSRFRGKDFEVLLGPLDDLEAPYDWGFLAAISAVMPGLYIGNVTSAISIRAAHARQLGLLSFAQRHGFACRGGADRFVLLSSALARGRRVYVPDRTVGYRIQETGDWASFMLSGDKCREYSLLFRTSLIQRWLLDRMAPRYCDLSDLLDLEIRSVTRPLHRHQTLYRQGCRIYARSLSCRKRLLSRFQKYLHGCRLWLFKKGINTFEKRAAGRADKNIQLA